MTINSNQYLQFNDYLTQIINVSGRNRIPKVTQALIAEKLAVSSSGVSHFLSGHTKQPKTMMTSFIVTYPLEFNRWPQSASTIGRIVTSSDVSYFLNPQQAVTSQIVVAQVPIVPVVQPWQPVAPAISTQAFPVIASAPTYRSSPSQPSSALINYFKRFKEGDTTVPGAAVQKSISELLDRTEAIVVNDLLNTLRSSDEHQARIRELNRQPRLAGSFSSDKIVLDYESASPFEQMAALSDWLAGKKIQKDHTFFFSTPDDDYIPVYVKKYSTDATAMHIMLGSKTGSHKAPKYDEWAETDPWFDEDQKRFIHPLESLEIIRQPGFSAATVLKGNAFERDLVDTCYRYGSEYACVEEKGQSKNSAKKIKSAGLNACSFTDVFSDVADPTADEVDVTLPVNYEDYTEEGYLDDLDISVTPGNLMKAAGRVLIKNQGDEKLIRLMENLTIAKLGVQRTPLLCERIAEKLAANNTADG